MQTLGAIRMQLYHQCFEQVWQHNFTPIIGLRRSTQRHRSSKVGTSIVDLRKSTHWSSKVDTSIIDLRRSTHQSSKIEGRNIAPTTQHRADILTICHRILSTTALHNWGEPERAPHLSYCCAKSSLYIYIYIYVPLVCPASNLVPQRAPLNAQRANVGPASNDSKVNNIALKKATMVLRFS